MKINTKDLFNFILIFFLLKPSGLDNYSDVLNNVLNAFRLLSLIFINFNFLLKIKKVSFTLPIIVLGIIEVITIISCFINGISPYNAIIYWHGILSLMLLAEINKDDLKRFCKILLYVLMLYTILNFLAILLFYILEKPVNEKIIFLLGAKNMPILYIFPCLVLLMINTLNNNIIKKARFYYLFLIICLISILVTHSATSTVAISLLVLYAIFYNNKLVNKILDKISIKMVFSIMILFFILIVIFGIQKYFSSFIVGILGKDLTFTGRTQIWEKAISLIKERPLLGFGWNYDLTNMYNTIFWQKYFDATNAHNFILNIGYKSGIIASISYLVYLYRCSNVLNKHRSNITNVLKISFVIFMILTTFEAYMSNTICLLFLTYLYYNCEKLGDAKNEN